MIFFIQKGSGPCTKSRVPIQHFTRAPNVFHLVLSFIYSQIKGHTRDPFLKGDFQSDKCNSRSTNLIDPCQIVILDLGRQIYLVNNFLQCKVVTPYSLSLIYLVQRNVTDRKGFYFFNVYCSLNNSQLIGNDNNMHFFWSTHGGRAV